MLSVSYDSERGLIRGISSGFHTVDDVVRYFGSLDMAVLSIRRDFGRIRIFVDSINASVQSAEVIEIFRARPELLTGPDDRLGVLKKSVLARMQAVRNFRSDKERFFASEQEALAWLLED